MDQDIHEKVSSYLRNQLAQAPARLKAYTVDNDGKSYFKKNATLILEKHLRNYTLQRKEPRWVTVAGLRGAGKTTMLAQIFTDLNCAENCKLYVSLDEATRVLGIGLKDILIVYEEVLGFVYEKLGSPVYLFIDEVQYEKEWGLILKSLYDRTKNVFIFCTGSSAVSLQTNPDISRRAVFEKLYPSSFTEYILFKYRKLQIPNLGSNIRDAIFNSSSAIEVYSKLEKLKPEVNKYWSGIDRLEIDKYFRYGTLPFTLQYTKEPIIYEQISRTLTDVLTKDIPQLGRFDQGTINKLDQILYAISGSNIVALRPMAEKFSMSVNTLVDVLSALEKAEVLLRIYPFGSHHGQVTNPSKYLFLSPAYRAMFFNLIGSTYSYDNYKGALLEDAMGLYFSRILGLRFGASLTYDFKNSGADFIISFESKKIVVEVGYGEKNFTQTENTMKRIDAAYGLSISPTKLTLSKDEAMVKIPLSYMLLI